MNMNIDELLREGNESELVAQIERVAVAYSTRLAFYLLEAYRQPFKRVVEDVQIDHGECRRRLTIDWRLPTLAEALPKHEYVDDARFIAKFAELGPDLAVPLLPMRKAALMNGFYAEDANGQRLYVCGQDESVKRTRLVLKTFWQWIDETASGSDDIRRDLLDQARNDFYALPVDPPTDARDMVSSVIDKLRASNVQLRADLVDRISLIGRYMARHHIVWLYLPRQPGQGVRLAVTYRTRFAAGYSPRRGGEKGLGTYRRYRRDDVRSRVPLVSRLGLVMVGGSAIYSLLAILLHRVTCAPGDTSSEALSTARRY